MIVLNPKNVKSNFKNVLDKYNSMNNLPYMECPTCNSTDLIKWGFYVRNINYIDDLKIVYNSIKIQRVKCKSCGHTHAIIPSFIVPYKVNLLDVILSSLLDDPLSLDISLDTIIKWRKDFNQFIPFLKTMFSNISISKIISIIKQDIFSYYDRFYLANKKILMMMRPQIIGFAYF